MVLTTAAQILGGVGVFLLAISLLTQGLQMISGDVLSAALARWTKTPPRGLLLGAVATALLQSSSAVTAILLGLVNAAVMPLGHAIWVIFGANVGTTMTGWLVSMTGFDFDIKVFALPFVGAGMLMKAFSRNWRLSAIGTALAGFGLFFVGVDILKGAFSAYSAQAGFESMTQSGILGLLGLTGAGFVMTVLTQSSSAATALILTGTAGGMLALPGGAAMIIGANLGTTSTAALAVIGASPNAKRAALAHIMFNGITAVVALALLPALLAAVTKMESLLDIAASPVVSLALFHTVFNVLGVALLSGFVPAMTRFLEKRFVSPVEENGKPAFIDSTTLNMPALAVSALIRELNRFRSLACESALDAFEGPLKDGADIEQQQRRDALSSLSAQIASFSGSLAQEKTAEDTSATLRAALRVNRYLNEISSLSRHARDMRLLLESMKDAESAAEIRSFIGKCAAVLLGIARDVPLSETILTDFNADYHKIKESVLESGARRKISIENLSALLDHLSASRRMIEQAIKAQRYMALLHDNTKAPAP